MAANVPAGRQVVSGSVLDKRNSADSLRHFASRIEERFRKAKGSFALEQGVCRLLESEDERVRLAAYKMVTEWLYGKPTETVQLEGTIQHEHEHRIKPENLTAEQLAVIEAAYIAPDPR